MPLFMDVHKLGDAVGIDDVAKAHMADLRDAGPARREVPALLGRRGRGHHLLPGRGAFGRRGDNRAP